MKNLDSIEIDQNVTARTVAVEHDGEIYMYGNGAKSLVRVIWDPETADAHAGQVLGSRRSSSRARPAAPRR